MPVSLHLDHCPDREWISDMPARPGWNSVLFDGSRSTSRRTPARRSRSSPRPSATAPTSRARSRACTASRTASAPMTQAESASGGGVGAVHRGDGDLLVRARDRHRARPVQAARRSSSLSGSPSSSTLQPDPDGAARRHRLDRGAVHGPDLPRMRQGQHLNGAEDRVRRRPPGIPGSRNPGKHDPPSMLSHVRTAVKKMAEYHIGMFGSAGRARR